MSLWNKTENNILTDASPTMPVFAKKCYKKIDPMEKLCVIHALDNGRTKVDIAKEYGVLPQTIAYIYKQKERILRRYTQKYNLLKGTNSVNVDQILKYWLQTELESGTVVNEVMLKKKAEEIFNSFNEDFESINDWLLEFQIRHNILKYSSGIDYGLDSKDWIKFYKNIDIRNLYVGGLCALLYSFDLDSYMSCKQNFNNYVSIFFVVHSSGWDKRELLVTGKESLDKYSWIKSYPVDYYYSKDSLINSIVFMKYLKKWDTLLQCKGETVWLLIDFPDIYVDKIDCTNIRVINLKNVNIFKSILEKVVECFKFNYRSLHMRKVICDKKSQSYSILDYLNIISLAWCNVSCKYIQQLMFPPEEGSLYFNNGKDDFDNNHSLYNWCKVNDIPLNLEYDCNLLDKYIFIDKCLPCLHLNVEFNNVDTYEDVRMKNEISSVSYGTEAFQAMKRIKSYLKGENADFFVLKSAKQLENHCEYGAIFEIHEVINSSKLKASK